jgi:hypothetical protein
LSNIYSSVYDSNQALKELNTEHFNIVFDETSINEALIIYDNCEQFYHEICDYFSLKRTQTFDVAITSDINSFNASFSLTPNPRIILKITPPVNNTFNYFSNELFLSTFKHELTHALTMTGENNIFKEIFSQSLTFNSLNMTKFNAEGLSLLIESLDGEGRLNNAYYKSRILEILLEDKFLKYNEVQGNRFFYPQDVFYLFGSFFYKYLIDTYGIVKFNEYVNEFDNFNIFFLDANYIFKKVYSRRLNDVWHEFRLSFRKPKTKEINYFEYNYLPDFIFKGNNEIFVNQSINDSIKKVETGKTIIKNLDQTYSANYNENQFVLSSYKKDKLTKTNTIIVDQTNKKKELSIQNFKMAIAYNDYIIGIYNEGQKQYIAFERNGVIEKKINVNDNEYIQKIDILDNQIVYSSKHDKKDKINILINDDTRKSYYIDDVEIMDFSIANNKIVLSTVKNDQLPRLAYIDLKNDQLYINKFDMVGGVFNPILIGDDVYYISKFFEYNKLRKANINQFDFDKVPININENIVSKGLPLEYNIDSFKDYNNLKYIFDGSLFAYILPENDFSTYTGNIYFESIDPAETLRTSLRLSTNLYDDFTSSLTLELFSSKGNVANNLQIDVKSSLINIQNTVPFISARYTYGKSFDLINNNLIFFQTNQTFTFPNYSLASMFELGFNHERLIGPTRDNKFDFTLSYQFLSNYDFINQKYEYRNVIIPVLYCPYLLPMLNSKNPIINLPFKVVDLLSIDNNNIISNNFIFSVLLYKMNFNKALTDIPFYLHNMQVFIQYEFTKSIELYTVFGASVTQTNLTRYWCFPGFKCSYDINSNTFKYEIGLYSSF